MSEDISIEAKRQAFFERARKAIQAGEVSTFSETELEQLWCGPNGRFDQSQAHEAFQRENIHWEWIQFREK